MEDIEVRGQTYVGMDTVSIPKADGSGDAEFVLPEGEEEITENGEYDVTRKKTARVNVQASGTDDYPALTNKPAINGVTLEGNQTAAQLGLVAAQQDAGLITDAERQQIQDNADDIAEAKTEIQQQGSDLQQLQTDVDAIEAKIPNQASAQNQLADKDFVNSSINSSTAFFRGAFATRAALFAVAWQTADPTAANYVSNNDYAYVADDEGQNDEAWRYIYVLETGGQNNGWQPQFRVNESPLTAAQLAALNSGATAALIAQITANQTAIAGKYTKPSTGIPKSDLASAVQTSLGRADTALQSVPSTYRTAEAQDTIDTGKIDKPRNPSSGAFLVWNGSTWAATTGVTLGIDEEDDRLYVYIGGVRQGTGIDLGTGYAGAVVLSAQSITIPEGESATFTVALDSLPQKNQKVYIVSSNPNLLSVTPAILTFTPANYATAQQVTVEALQNEDMGDNTVTVTVTLRADSTQIPVTIQDDDTPVVTQNGMVLNAEFAGHENDESDTFVESKAGLSFKGFSNFIKYEKGIGSTTTSYKYLTVVNDDKKSAFLAAMKETGEFTVEIFGTVHPKGAFFPNYRELAGTGVAGTVNTSGWYNSAISVAPTRILQDDTSVYTNLTLGNEHTFTINGTTKRLIIWNKDSWPYGTDFRHIVFTYAANGDIYLTINGVKMDIPLSVENFKAWDFDAMFGGSFSLLNNTTMGAGFFVSNIRVYNRVLTDEEIQKNMKANAIAIGLTNF